MGLIEDPANTIFISAATVWEISLKEALGRLELPAGFDKALAETGFEMLAIQPRHARATLALPPPHRDPFDRMLVAQATVEKLVLLTADSQDGEPVRLT